MRTVQQRGVRFLEEAIELYQAAGADKDKAHELVDYIFGRPVGELGQEFGGVGVTLLALAEAASLDADSCERTELKRVLALPPEHLAQRNREKNAAGFDVTGAYPIEVPAGAKEAA
jgi:hypothetical protein